MYVSVSVYAVKTSTFSADLVSMKRKLKEEV